jgi:hypothetical protein
MSGMKLIIAAAIALGLTGCTTHYGSLYPKPLAYRYGKPQPNFGYGPLPIPGGAIPVRPKDWQDPNP